MKGYDVIIIGGGLVGASFALGLKNQGLKIAICENNLPSFSLTPSSIRPICLSYGSYVILKKIEVWDEIEPISTPIDAVHVSEHRQFGKLSFTAEEEKLKALGYVVPAHQLHQILLNEIKQHPEINIIPIKNLQKLTVDENQTCVTLETEKDVINLSAELLIACDGAQSTCRQLLDIKAQKTDLQQISISGLIKLQRPHQQIAYQRFTQRGIIAILPAKQNDQCYWIWTTQQKIAEQIRQSSNDQIKIQLQEFLGDRIGSFKSTEIIGFFPLHMMQSDEQIRPGVVLLGNAAHTLYPIAAQGFNLGLRDASLLSEILISAKNAGHSLGNFELLKDYEKQRQDDQNATMNLTRRISEIFSWDFPFLNTSRGAGLLLADIFKPLKRRISKITLGRVYT